jgi:hypothetical protein
MGKINVGRWILGGIIAGVVADILGTLVDGVILAPRWTDGMNGACRFLAESMDLVQCAGSHQWNCRNLDLRRNPATIRGWANDRDLCRTCRMGFGSAVAKPKFHGLWRSFLEALSAIHHARGHH